jgi:hypothetical protein
MPDPGSRLAGRCDGQRDINPPNQEYHDTAAITGARDRVQPRKTITGLLVLNSSRHRMLPAADIPASRTRTAPNEWVGSHIIPPTRTIAQIGNQIKPKRRR